MPQNEQMTRLLRRIVEREVSDRQDALVRAKIEHSRQRMTAAELKDYFDDCEVGRRLAAFVEKLLRGSHAE